MRYFLTLCFFICFGAVAQAQPELQWLSYFGGSMTNTSAVHYDSIGKCIYIAGATGDSLGIATSGSFKDQFTQSYNIPAQGGREMDAFLSKWDLDGHLLWATYYGGHEMEHSMQVKTDKWGNVYLLGFTRSDTGIASPSASLSDFKTSAHYLAKFNSYGERLWATYLSISDTMTINDSLSIGHYMKNNIYLYQLDIDADGNVYAGFTAWLDKEIGTTGTHKSERNMPESFMTPVGEYPLLGDAALVKYDSSGVKQWGTYYGGGSIEWLYNLYCSSDGSVYLLGSTESDTGIATPGTYQSVFPSGSVSYGCNFLTKFNSSGQRDWGTYICIPGQAICTGITGDEAGNIYVMGFTSSTQDVSTPGVYQELPKGGTDIFIMKFDSTGQKLWGTYLGGSGGDQIGARMQSAPSSYYYISDITAAGSLVYVASEGALYLGGGTSDTTGWNATCGYTTKYANEGFLAKMDTSGQMLWTSHFDSPIYDISVAQMHNGKNEIYFVGGTLYDSLATPGAYNVTKPTVFAGMVGKFIEEYICDSITLNLIYDAGELKADDGYETYNWYQNGVLIFTDTNSAFLISDTTGYYYVLATKCGCSYQSDTFVFSPTSISELFEGGHLSLYPNPVMEELIISFDQMAQLPFSAFILDLSGKILIEEQFVQGNFQKSIDVSSLRPGIYFVKISTDKNHWVGKFVKK